MNCDQIKESLSEYVDGVMDEATREIVEQHLATCEGCRKELSALQSLIENLKSLPPVAPPTDFLRQLHKRIEQPSRMKQIVEKLFFPIKFKIPLQLAGAALAALLVFSVYTIQQEPYEGKETPRALKKENTDQTRQVARADKAVGLAQKPAVRAAAPMKGERLIELTLLLAKTAPVPQPAAPAPTRALGRKAMEKASEAHQEAFQTAPAEKAEKAREMDDPVMKVIAAWQGRVLSVEKEKQEGQSISILAEVPSDKLRSLVENLRQLGKVHVPSFTPFDEVQGLVKIRVRIVAAE